MDHLVITASHLLLRVELKFPVSCIQKQYQQFTKLYMSYILRFTLCIYRLKLTNQSADP